MSVIGCAFVMVAGSCSVIQESIGQLYDGFALGKRPQLELGPIMYAVLGAATLIKAVLFVVCFTLRHRSGAALALAEDHLNDGAHAFGVRGGGGGGGGLGRAAAVVHRGAHMWRARGLVPACMPVAAAHTCAHTRTLSQ